MQAMNQYIKELERHGTYTIVSRKSVTGAQILPITWAFKVKCFPNVILSKFKAILCARVDRQVEGVD